MSPGKLLRILLIVAILGGWLLLRWFKPEWAMVFTTPWRKLADDFGWWVPAVGGGLWLILLVTLLWSAYGPRRSRKPDDAMALGCITMAAFAVAGIVVVLAASLLFHLTVLINLISFLAILLALFILPQLAWALWQDHQKHARRTR